MKNTKLLLEDYERKLITVCAELDSIPSLGEEDPKYVRLKEKASNYRTLIAELSKSLKQDREAVEERKLESFTDWCKETLGIGDVNSSDLAEKMTLETLKWDYLNKAYEAGYEDSKKTS
jgi:hypothetical protein